MHLTGFTWNFALVVGLLSGAAWLAQGANAQGTSKSVTGVWIDHTGQGAVEIAPCGDKFCGRVVWLKNPAHKSKTGKLICGTQVLGELQQMGRDAWESGWIYNPEDEEKFSAALKLANADTLIVTGYLGVKFLGETFTWKRANTEFDRCSGPKRAS